MDEINRQDYKGNEPADEELSSSASNYPKCKHDAPLNELKGMIQLPTLTTLTVGVGPPGVLLLQVPEIGTR